MRQICSCDRVRASAQGPRGTDEGPAVAGPSRRSDMVPGVSPSRGDPAVDLGFQHVQRHRAVLQHFGVEFADVELRRPVPSRPWRAAPGSSARRSCTPAPGPGWRCSARLRRWPGFRSRPSCRACTRSPARGSSPCCAGRCRRPGGSRATVRSAGSRSSRTDRCRRPASLPSDSAYRPQPSAKAVSPPKRRNAGRLGQLLLQRDLEVVARDGLVQVQVFGVPGLARGQVVGVDVEDAGTRAVLARASGTEPPAADLARNASTGRISNGAFGRQRELLGDLLVDLRFQRAVVRRAARPRS